MSKPTESVDGDHKLKSEGAVERTYRRVKRDILSGAHSAGAHLKEEELAVMVGVSRTPVREALRRLGAEGLVDFQRHQGAVVAHWSIEEIEEIFGLRAVLEPYVAELAAARILTPQIDELTRLADSMEASVLGKNEDFIGEVSTLNGEFHKILLRASENRRLSRILSGLIEMPIVLRTYAIYSQEELWRSFGHHREIISSMRSRDAQWAASVMRCHVLAARKAYSSATRNTDRSLSSN